MQHKFKQANDGDECESPSRGFEVAFIPHKTGTYFIEITSAIRSAAQFSDAIQVLELAGYEDEVVIKLQTPGGSLDATDAFVHAMRKCKAPIHIVATGGVHSAGTKILLEAESFELSEDFNSLIHCGACGTIGNTNEVIAQSKFLEQYMTRFMTSTYEGFLSKVEIEELIKGVDIWLTAEDWITRYEARNEYISERIAALGLEEEAAKVLEEKAASKKPRKLKKDVDIAQAT